MEPISKEMALQKVRERLAKISQNEIMKQNTETLNMYLTTTMRNGSTVMLDAVAIVNYLFPYLEKKNVLIKDLTEMDISEALNGLKAKETTLIAYAKKILAFANWEKGRYKMPKLELVYVTIPRGEAKSHIIHDQLTDEMVAKTISKIQSPRVKLAVYLMWKFGLRISEALGLRWEDLQRRNGQSVIIVRHRPGDYGAKGVKGEREISIDDIIGIGMLSANEKREINMLMKEIKEKYNSERIINIRKTVVQEGLLKAGKKAGIQIRLHPHLLRHHWVVSAFDHGASTTLVQKVTGDALITISQYYMIATVKPK